MKESDKGLLAVAVFLAIFYLSKKDAYSDMRWGGAMYPGASGQSHSEAQGGPANYKPYTGIRN